MENLRLIYFKRFKFFLQRLIFCDKMHPQVKSNLFLASTCWLQEGEFTFLESTGVIKNLKRFYTHQSIQYFKHTKF